MYLIFPENLPESVLFAEFVFASETAPFNLIVGPKTKIKDKGATIDVQEGITHIRAIEFHTFNDEFTYFYPGLGFRLEDGAELPAFVPPTAGSLYGNGIVLQTGTCRPDSETEEDILPYKGSAMALHERTVNYDEALSFCETLTKENGGNWQLPDILDLAFLYNNREKLNLGLLKQRGTLLQDEEFWCQDNSVADLGVVFDMGNGNPLITQKNEKRQIRPVLHF